MENSSAVRELLIDPILRRNLSASIDGFLLETADGPISLGAVVRYDTEADGIRVELSDCENRDLRKFFPKKNKFGLDDTLRGTGTLGGRIKIVIAGIWPPDSSSTRPIGPVQTSTASVSANQIEIPVAGLDGLTSAEIKSLLDDPRPDQGETSTTDDASKSSATQEFEHLAFFANTKLKFKNTALEWSEFQEFWGESSGSKTVSWDGEAFGGRFSLMQDGEHLKVGFRHSATGVEDARQRAKALFSAICYTHGIQPWPSYLKVSENGKTIEERLKAVRRAQGKMIPLRERHGHEYPDAPTKLIASVAEWIRLLLHDERDDVGHALWVFRSADHRAAPSPVQLAMIGAVIEGLFDSLNTGTTPASFTEMREEAISWAKEAESASSDPERSAFAKRLSGYLNNWSYQDRRTAWKTAFAPLFPGREIWLDALFSLYQKYRNPPAHGDFVASMRGDSHEMIENLGRLAGFVNLVIAAKSGYRGPILESPFADTLIKL